MGRLRVILRWLLVTALILGLQVQCFDEIFDDVGFGDIGGSKCALQLNRKKAPRHDEDVLSDSSIDSDNCITYEAVNGAFKKAKNRLRLNVTTGDKASEVQVRNLGDIILETSRILAYEYRIPPKAIYKLLPTLDTRKTQIYRYCPGFLKFPKCEVKRYREYNGMCNNLAYPHWGAALAPSRRMLPPRYSDGISRLRVSVTGEKLPRVRRISTSVHQDLGHLSQSLNVAFNAWGQAMAHDITQTADSIDPATGEEPVCCDKPKETRYRTCLPIPIPSDDQFYKHYDQTCMEFARSAVGLRAECRLGPRNQLDLVTSYLDGSFLYGSSKEIADKMRARKGGLLRSIRVSKDHKELLPFANASATIQRCLRETSSVCDFFVGDDRVNQQPMIAFITTVMLREHNRIASELAKINPHWNDEKLYQETRLLMGALTQHINYNEFLPIVLGEELMDKYDLYIREKGYFNGYDPKIDATMPLEFVSAGYRFCHPITAPTVQRFSLSNKFLSAQRLRGLLNTAQVLLKQGEFDLYTNGFLNQAAGAETGHETIELTDHLFQDKGKCFGQDLASIDMQRGLDHGLPTYNDVRQMCGLKRARVWSDLYGVFPNATLQQYFKLYKSPDDIHLWSAGVSEIHMKDSIVGPVFGCILAKTFSEMRRGDRFWFENPNWPSSFTLRQLKAIRKMTLSRIICDNTDKLKSIQRQAMLLPHPELNPRISCRSSALPRLDLSAWRE